VRWASVGLISIWGMTGCANYEPPAREAIKQAQATINAIGPEARKYVPDQYADLEQGLASAKASFDKGDYKSALAGARTLPPRISKVMNASTAAKEQSLTALRGQWETMNSETPKMVEAIDKRLTTLSKSKRLPKDVSPTNVETAKSSVEAIKQQWTAASQDAARGRLEDAVAKASEVQTKGRDVMTQLGMPPQALASAPAPATR